VHGWGELYSWERSDRNGELAAAVAGDATLDMLRVSPVFGLAGAATAAGALVLARKAGAVELGPCG
jgi:hypothetical protein